MKEEWGAAVMLEPHEMRKAREKMSETGAKRIDEASADSVNMTKSTEAESHQLLEATLAFVLPPGNSHQEQEYDDCSKGKSKQSFLSETEIHGKYGRVIYKINVFFAN